MTPAHQLASRPDAFGQTLTRPSRSDVGRLCTHMIRAFFGKTELKQHGCMLAIMAITVHSQNLSTRSSMFTIIHGSCHKYHFCRNKGFVTTNTCLCVCHDNHMFVCLSQQKYACRNKPFVATNIFLSWQQFCHDKHNFVMTSLLLSWQTHVCHDKTCLLCHNKSFVVKSTLSWKKTRFVMMNMHLRLSWQNVCDTCGKNDICGSSYQWKFTGSICWYKMYVSYGQHDCWYYCMSPVDSMIDGTSVCPLWTAWLMALVYVPCGQHDWWH